VKAIEISSLDLSIVAGLMLLFSGFTFWQQLHIERSLLIGAARAWIQLWIIGILLKILFHHVSVTWILLFVLAMFLVAIHEVHARQHHQLVTKWRYAMSAGSLFLTAFSLVMFTLWALIHPPLWYQPQYLLPLLGMVLANTMTGVSLSMDSFMGSLVSQEAMILQRLALGQSAKEAVSDLRREAVRRALIPSINAMATAGIVSLPGMMTGQIIAGSSPTLAVKYQILILFLITISTGLGILLALHWLFRYLFDERERLRLERIKNYK